MDAPLVGITTTLIRSTGRLSLASEYAQAVVDAGGVPILIPVNTPPQKLAQLRNKLDGVILSGGADIDPAFFKGKNHPAVYDILNQRDELEFALVDLARRTSWPLLGICRGHQVINVALGGSLYTHIPDELEDALNHDLSEEPRSAVAHSVIIEPASTLGRIFNQLKIKVNSHHHQGIDRLGFPLIPSGRSSDNLIEAVELEDHPFFIGVQWHPECMPDTPHSQQLFSAFTQACMNHHE